MSKGLDEAKTRLIHLRTSVRMFLSCEEEELSGELRVYAGRSPYKASLHVQIAGVRRTVAVQGQFTGADWGHHWTPCSRWSRLDRQTVCGLKQLCVGSGSSLPDTWSVYWPLDV